MFIIIEKGGNIDQPLVEFSTFAKAAKWLIECAELVAKATGGDFEVWFVKRFKTKSDVIELEAEFEVLP